MTMCGCLLLLIGLLIAYPMLGVCVICLNFCLQLMWKSNGSKLKLVGNPEAYASFDHFPHFLRNKDTESR